MKKIVMLAALLSQFCGVVPVLGQQQRCQYRKEDTAFVNGITILRPTGQPINGVVCVYHENRRLAIEAPYRDGKEEGIMRTYRENGTLAGVYKL